MLSHASNASTTTKAWKGHQITESRILCSKATKQKIMTTGSNNRPYKNNPKL